MAGLINFHADYDRPIKIAEDVYWVGVYDEQHKAHTNTYILVDQREAVLIDGGSRPDFPSVMIKILQLGLTPSSIGTLVYQNCAPHFCGSIPHLESIIGRKDLKVISDRANQLFLSHYFESNALLALEEIDHCLQLSSGRALHFIKTPFAHSAGSFITFDSGSGVLFSGHLFGSYASDWNLFLKLGSECRACEGYRRCLETQRYCPICDILQFHQDIMTSERALKYALDRIATVPFTIVAPQHGRVINHSEDIVTICESLSALRGVGIDGVIGSKSFFELGNTEPIRERLAGSTPRCVAIPTGGNNGGSRRMPCS